MIPDELPQDMNDLIADLKEAKSEDIALRKAYDVITERFPGKRLTAYVMFWRLFDQNPFRIWTTYKRIPCTTMNWLLIVILVKSGWFTEQQFELRWTTVWLTPHQYLRVHFEDHHVDLDPWGAAFGIAYGEHA